MNNSRLVYSTESGKICPSCKKRVSVCRRKGKTVTTLSGFQINADELKNLATQLKRRCGTGDSVKDGIIIIQGDHRETLVSELTNRGFKAKISGG